MEAYSGSPTAARVASAPPEGREALDRELRALYEQLLAARLDLVHGTVAGDTQPALSRGTLECVLAQLDGAIDATRDMVAHACTREVAARGLFGSAGFEGAA